MGEPSINRRWLVIGGLLSLAGCATTAQKVQEQTPGKYAGEAYPVRLVDRRKFGEAFRPAELPMSTDRKFLEGQVVLVGYGRVGRRVGRALAFRHIPFVVAEQNRELVEDLRKQGIAAVSGDATDPTVLIQAHIAQAAMLVVATPDPLNVRQMVNTAKTLNPEIEIVLRTHSEDESRLFRKENLGTVFFGEEELAKGMTEHVLERFDPQFFSASDDKPS